MTSLVEQVALAIAREDCWPEDQPLGTRYRRHAKAAINAVMLDRNELARKLADASDECQSKIQWMTSDEMAIMLERRTCQCDEYWTGRDMHSMSHTCYHVGDVLDALEAIVGKSDD